MSVYEAEHEDFRKTARTFFEREVTPHHDQWEKDGIVPREVWLAADHSKFNRPAMVELGHVSQLDRLFTDQVPPPPFPAMLAEADVQCDVAE